MAHLVRSASLSGFHDLALSLGIDPLRAVAAVGLTGQCLFDGDLRISAKAVNRLLDATAKATGHDDIGLRLAEKRNLSNLGPVGLIVREQPTIRAALGALMRYLPIHNEAVQLHLREEDDETFLHVIFFASSGASSRHSIELVVGVLYRILKAMLGQAWQAKSIHFVHRGPRSLDVHTRMFARICRFGSEFNGIAIRRKDLDRPVPTADPEMARHVQRYLDTMADSRDAGYVQQIRELVRVMLPSGVCTIEKAALHLG